MWTEIYYAGGGYAINIPNYNNMYVIKYKYYRPILKYNIYDFYPLKPTNQKFS